MKKYIVKIALLLAIPVFLSACGDSSSAPGNDKKVNLIIGYS